MQICCAPHGERMWRCHACIIGYLVPTGRPVQWLLGHRIRYNCGTRCSRRLERPGRLQWVRAPPWHGSHRTAMDLRPLHCSMANVKSKVNDTKKTKQAANESDCDDNRRMRTETSRICRHSQREWGKKGFHWSHSGSTKSVERADAKDAFQLHCHQI